MSDHSKFTRVRNVGNVARKTFSDFDKKRSNGTPLRIGKIQEIRSRYECPACHRKRMFVRYINTTTDGYLFLDVGRDCGYLYIPQKYFHNPPEEEEQQGYIKGKS